MTSRPYPATLLNALIVVLASSVCCSGRKPKATAPPAAAQAKPPSHAKALSGKPDMVHARTFDLRHYLDLPDVGVFARLSTTQQRHIEELRAAGAFTVRVHVLPDRMLVVLPPSHPAGDLELLLSDAHDRLIAFGADEWAYTLPRERLPDLLDRAEPSKRELQAATMRTPARASTATTHAGHAGPAVRTVEPLSLSEYGATAHLRYRVAAQRTRIWSLRLRVDWSCHLAASQPSWAADQLYQLMLPLLHTRRGRLVLESIAHRSGGLPARWRRTLVNERFAEDLDPVFVTEVQDRGWTRLARSRLAGRRNGFRSGGRIPAPAGPGNQQVAADKLAALRSGKPGGRLRVRNDSGRAALIYLDGALIGWVAPNRSITFEGAKQGYYRLYAVSPSAVRSWGPSNVYLPGPFVLR